LDKSSYEALINHLNTLTPFEAIRYANEINKMNGFEVLSRVVIREWKKTASENLKNKILNMKNPKTESHFHKNKTAISQSRKSKYGFSKSKIDQLQRGYMKLINT